MSLKWKRVRGSRKTEFRKGRYKENAPEKEAGFRI